jgi:prepilin-type N-terminal cleavage/methylation domain-containing protein
MKDYPRIASDSVRNLAGFTFVEMLVAVAISAVCIGTGALAIMSIGTNAKRTTSIIDIDIGESTNQNFYGNTGGNIRTYQAPNFGKIMFAQEIRDKLVEDSSRSSAVYCLPRSSSVPNTIRPETLSYPGGTVERPNLDTPEAFRVFLATVEPTSTGIFTSAIRNLPGANFPCTTIFLLGPSNLADKIQVNAIYEIDFVTPSNLTGIYASVRRYVGTALTHYYDVFYPPGNGDGFYPQFVAFEHMSRQLANEAADIKRFQIAPTAPFYLVWLPDPSLNPYKKSPWTNSDPTTMARSTYEHMAEKTSLSLVLPMFPSL